MTSPQIVQRAHNSSRGIFFLHGAGFASWIPHIPLVQKRLDLGHGDLGFALMAGAIGVLAAMPIAGRMADRVGSDRVVRYSGLTYFPALTIPLFMKSLGTLSLALFVMGFTAAFVNIAMNANGLNVERAKGKTVLSGLHGFWSLGGFTGAGFAALWFALPVPQMWHLPFSVVGLLTLHWYWQRTLLPDPVRVPKTEETANKSRGRTMVWVLLPFGLCAFIGQFGEGVMTDWATVLINTHLRSGPMIAAVGFACYSAAMAMTRLSGDRLASRFGRGTVLMVSCGLATTGYLTLALASHYIIAWIGCFVAGVGLAVVLPLLISAAAGVSGKGGGAVVAAIAATGNTALMAGPPIIGAIGQHYGLVNAFLITSGFLVMIVPVYMLTIRSQLKTVGER